MNTLTIELGEPVKTHTCECCGDTFHMGRRQNLTESDTGAHHTPGTRP